MKTWHWLLIIAGILILLYIWKKGKEVKSQNNNTGNLGGGGGLVGTNPGNPAPQIG